MVFCTNAVRYESFRRVFKYMQSVESGNTNIVSLKFSGRAEMYTKGEIGNIETGEVSAIEGALNVFGSDMKRVGNVRKIRGAKGK